MRFGKATKVMRLIRGMSQRDLGLIIDVNPTFISQMETKNWLPPEDVQLSVRVALAWDAEHDTALDRLDKESRR